MMTKFLKEYAGTQWGAWFALICVLSAPFLSSRICKLSIVWLQIANFILVFGLGGALSGTCHGMDGDVAMGIATFYGFGVGYSILALRREEAFEKTVGAIGVAFFGLLVTMTVLNQCRYM